MTNDDTAARSARLLWACLGGEAALLDGLVLTGPPDVLPSRYAVTPFASAAVGVAALAVAELWALRTGTRHEAEASVSSFAASAAFRSEALFEPVGWERPPVWDPIAGDYLAADGFVRLHTNYAAHRRAALGALGLSGDADRARVAQAVAPWRAEALETAVVAAGGCAARLLTRASWDSTPHGRATADEPPIAIGFVDGERGGPPSVAPERPLSGVRVLDLTRVLAGPACTRFLAAHGAEVLRIDPPGFEEVPAVVPDMTAGKRCAALDLRSEEGRARFLALVAEADVLVCGYRPGALVGLGLDDATLARANPRTIRATLSAYGFSGPWRGRRGFDSLVQMSVGLAASPLGPDEKPSPLPAQALDHGLGYLAAAGVVRALGQRLRTGAIGHVRGSLLGVAHHLAALPRPSGVSSSPALAFSDEHFERAPTAWGEARRVRCPGVIPGAPAPCWSLAPGPLGSAPPSFERTI